MSSETIEQEREDLRVEELLSYEIMGAPAEFAFDDIVDFASEITACPVAFVHFIDSEKQWAMAAANVPRETSECHREDSICNVVIRQNDVVVIPDTLEDERFKDIACVRDTPNVRFYIGAPLINAKGFALGTLCLVDFEPRTVDYEKVEAIKVEVVLKEELIHPGGECRGVGDGLDELRAGRRQAAVVLRRPPQYPCSRHLLQRPHEYSRDRRHADHHEAVENAVVLVVHDLSPKAVSSLSSFLLSSIFWGFQADVARIHGDYTGFSIGTVG